MGSVVTWPRCGRQLTDRKLAGKQEHWPSGRTLAPGHTPASTRLEARSVSQKSSVLTQVGNCGWLVFSPSLVK